MRCRPRVVEHGELPLQTRHKPRAPRSNEPRPTRAFRTYARGVPTVLGEDVVETSLAQFAKALASAVLFGGFAFLVVLGLSGELGHWLSGIRQSEPPVGTAPRVVLRLAVAAGATAGVFAATIAWQLVNRGLRGLAAAALSVVALILALRTPSPTEATVVVLPAAAAVAALGVARLRERQESMLRGQACGRLWASVFLASCWAVVALTLI